MNDEGTKSIGKVYILDSATQKPLSEVAITDMVRSTFKDHRMCTVARTEENTFVVAIENPPSTGRLSLSQMHLTEDSMIALVSCISLFYEHNKIDLRQKVKDILMSDTLNFEYS